jgi:hypothetical protein
MGLPKGKTNNPNGRLVGSQNKKTRQWELLGESIAYEHTERFNQLLNESDDETFMEYYLKTIEYFQPKLQRSEVKQETTGEQTIKIVREGNTYPPIQPAPGSSTDIA